MTEEMEITESEPEEEDSSSTEDAVKASFAEMLRTAPVEWAGESPPEEARMDRILEAVERVLTIPSSIWSFSAGVIIPPLIPLQATTPLLSWAFAALGFTYAFLGLAQYHGAILASQGKTSALVTIRSQARIKSWAHWGSIALAFVCAQGLTSLRQGGFGTDFRADLLPFYITATGTSFAILYTTAARYAVEQS